MTPREVRPPTLDDGGSVDPLGGSGNREADQTTRVDVVVDVCWFVPVLKGSETSPARVCFFASDVETSSSPEEYGAPTLAAVGAVPPCLQAPQKRNHPSSHLEHAAHHVRADAAFFADVVFAATFLVATFFVAAFLGAAVFAGAASTTFVLPAM